MKFRLIVLLSFVATQLCFAPPERYRLYTKPDPDSTGGIKGEILGPKKRVLEVFACPPDEPRFVYRAKLSGDFNNKFVINGLPARKYDLTVIYDDAWYEGFSFVRGEDTLTTEDREKISATIQKSEPYFTKRIIHRMAGTTGRGNEARAVATFLRDTKSTNRSDWRRSFRLFIMKDVGPGWQVVRSRDIYPTDCKPGNGDPPHFYEKGLSRVRVSDYVKDAGQIILKTR